MRRIFLILVVFVITSFPYSAEANTCRIPQGKDTIADFEVIFKGRVLGTHRSYLLWKPKEQPDSYTEFEVLDVFKGDIGQKVKVYHSRKQDLETPSVVFERDAEEVVFAYHRGVDNFYRAHKCGVHTITEDTLRVLEQYKDDIHLLNGLRGEYGEDRFFKAKFKLLGDYKDYRELRKAYESYFKQNYEIDLQGMREKHGSKTREIIRQRMKNEAETVPEPYRPRTDLPDYLKLFTIPHGDRKGYSRTTQNIPYLLPYARILFELHEYRDAIWFLEIASRGEVPGADLWRLQTLVKLGLTNEFDKRGLKFSGIKLEDIDLSYLKLEHSDFSKAVINTLDITGAKLLGADFKESEIIRLTAAHTLLSGADFSDAKIYGDFQNADLSSIKAINAELGGNFMGTSLKYADLRGATLVGELDRADLTEALYDNATVWPQDFDPLEAGALLER